MQSLSQRQPPGRTAPPGHTRTGVAVGRVAIPVMPRSHVTNAEYILDEEFLLCLMCQRWMQPTPRADGQRAYGCGSACRQRDLSAAQLESRLELAALIRAVTTLCPDLAHIGPSNAAGTATMADLGGGDKSPADAEELRRWRACNLADRRALVRTGYLRAEVDAQGLVHLIPRGHGAT